MYKTVSYTNLKAEKFIFLEYFIIDEGRVWDSVLEILQRKADEGVEVRLLYDGMGSQFLLPTHYNKYLETKGIKCKVFNEFRPFLSTAQNNRDHRKILVVDGITAFNLSLIHISSKGIIFISTALASSIPSISLRSSISALHTPLIVLYLSIRR